MESNPYNLKVLEEFLIIDVEFKNVFSLLIWSIVILDLIFPVLLSISFSIIFIFGCVLFLNKFKWWSILIFLNSILKIFLTNLLRKVLLPIPLNPWIKIEFGRLFDLYLLRRSVYSFSKPTLAVSNSDSVITPALLFLCNSVILNAAGIIFIFLFYREQIRTRHYHTLG